MKTTTNATLHDESSKSFTNSLTHGGNHQKVTCNHSPTITVDCPKCGKPATVSPPSNSTCSNLSQTVKDTIEEQLSKLGETMSKNGLCGAITDSHNDKLEEAIDFFDEESDEIRRVHGPGCDFSDRYKLITKLHQNLCQLRWKCFLNDGDDGATATKDDKTTPS